jgi:hypothetical protein
VRVDAFQEHTAMKPLAALAVTALLWGCGPDRELLMDTKFDALLRQKVMALSTEGRSEDLNVIGRCNELISGTMRQGLMDAGAEVLEMNSAVFTARVSSDDVFSLAALEFVTQLRLVQSSNPPGG